MHRMIYRFWYSKMLKEWLKKSWRHMAVADAFISSVIIFVVFVVVGGEINGDHTVAVIGAIILVLGVTPGIVIFFKHWGWHPMHNLRDEAKKQQKDLDEWTNQVLGPIIKDMAEKRKASLAQLPTTEKDDDA